MQERKGDHHVADRDLQQDFADHRMATGLEHSGQVRKLLFVHAPANT